MVAVGHILLLAGLSSAQLFGDRNEEYSGLGKYVTLLNAGEEYKSDNYGASVLGSNGDTTTFAIIPTKLNENGTKYPSEYTDSRTIGPTTVILSATGARTYTDMSYTFAQSCSFSGTTTAVCAESMGGMPKPCDAGIPPGDGFPGGSFLRTLTYGPFVDFATYELVSKTTTIKDTDPTPTPKITDGPFPEEWSQPRTITDSVSAECPITTGAVRSSKPDTSSKVESATSSVISSTSVSATTPSPSTAGQGQVTIQVIPVLVIALSFALL